MARFSVTFERWTPDDIDAGETDSRGFVVQDASLRDALAECGDRPEWARATGADEWPVRSPRWFTFDGWNDGTRESIEDGIRENRALHIPDGVTPSSRRRIARLLGLQVQL